MYQYIIYSILVWMSHGMCVYKHFICFILLLGGLVYISVIAAISIVDFQLT